MATETNNTQDVNYTEAQENVIRSVFADKGAPLNYDDCKTIAARDDMQTADGSERKPRSIAAKISRMDDVEYERQQATSKDGSPVVHKSDLVEEIAQRVTGNLDGLEKAPKPALKALRDYVAAASA